MTETTVVIGAGHAAGQLLASLKQHEYEGRVVLLGDESWLPYQRPPLSKKFLSGELPAERLLIKPPAFFEDEAFDVRLGTRVSGIDRKAARLALDDGSTVAYDKLVLATGARVNRLACEGAELDGIHYLRNIDDVERIRADHAPGSKVLIVGAGYIGLEVAAVLRQAGSDVTVLEAADRVMSRVVSAQVSSFFEAEHTAHGVDLRLSTGLERFSGDGRLKEAETTAGDRLAADLAVVGIGIRPNVELAQAAGLAVHDGIAVDDRCRTSDPAVFAIGDCTSHPNRIYGRELRLESVQNALEQAKTAAAVIAGGDAVYDEVPWFWSDQYDLKLQIAGLSNGHDETLLRGDPADRSFSCVYLKAGRMIAIDCINAPRDFMQSKPLIAAGAQLNSELLGDASTSLKELQIR